MFSSEGLVNKSIEKYYRFTGDYSELLDYPLSNGVKEIIKNGSTIYSLPINSIYCGNDDAGTHECGYGFINLYYKNKTYGYKWQSFIACGFKEITEEEFLRETEF